METVFFSAHVHQCNIAFTVVHVQVRFNFFFNFILYYFLARLAQLVKSLTANQEVPGSIPGLVEG